MAKKKLSLDIEQYIPPGKRPMYRLFLNWLDSVTDLDEMERTGMTMIAGMYAGGGSMTEEEAHKTIEWVDNVVFDVMLLSLFLRGHIRVTFTDKGPSFGLTPAGRRAGLRLYKKMAAFRAKKSKKKART